MKDVLKAKKMQRKTWNELAETLPITGDALRVAFSRDSVDDIYLNQLRKVLNIEGYKEQYEQKSELNEDALNYSERIKVPYYDVDFTAGFLEVENNQQIKPDSYITHPFFKGCDYVVRASGQSMAKVIKHGDAIGLIKLNNWMNFLPNGEIYAIVTKDGHRLIKVVTSSGNKEILTLISKPTENKKDEFPPQDINKSNILAVYKVQATSHLF